MITALSCADTRQKLLREVHRLAVDAWRPQAQARAARRLDIGRAHLGCARVTGRKLEMHIHGIGFGIGCRRLVPLGTLDAVGHDDLAEAVDAFLAEVGEQGAGGYRGGPEAP